MFGGALPCISKFFKVCFEIGFSSVHAGAGGRDKKIMVLTWCRVEKLGVGVIGDPLAKWA